MMKNKTLDFFASSVSAVHSKMTNDSEKLRKAMLYDSSQKIQNQLDLGSEKFPKQFVQTKNEHKKQSEIDPHQELASNQTIRNKQKGYIESKKQQSISAFFSRIPNQIMKKTQKQIVAAKQNIANKLPTQTSQPNNESKKSIKITEVVSEFDREQQPFALTMKTKKSQNKFMPSDSYFNDSLNYSNVTDVEHRFKHDSSHNKQQKRSPYSNNILPKQLKYEQEEPEKLDSIKVDQVQNTNGTNEQKIKQRQQANRRQQTPQEQIKEEIQTPPIKIDNTSSSNTQSPIQNQNKHTEQKQNMHTQNNLSSEGSLKQLHMHNNRKYISSKNKFQRLETSEASGIFSTQIQMYQEKIQRLNEARQKKKQLQQQLKQVNEEIKIITQMKVEDQDYPKHKINIAVKNKVKQMINISDNHEAKLKAARLVYKLHMQRRQRQKSLLGEFQKLDVGIISSINQLTKIKEQQEIKLKEKKKIEIINRMKDNERRKLEQKKLKQLSMMFVNSVKQQQVQQHKSFEQQNKSSVSRLNQPLYTVNTPELKAKKQKLQKVRNLNGDKNNKKSLIQEYNVLLFKH